MSSSAIRNWSADLVRQVLPEAPFQKTISTLEQQKNLPEIWSTIEYTDAGSQRLTIGKRAIWREFGSFSVIILCKSGYGEEQITLLGEKFFNFATDVQQNIVEATTGITGRLRIENVSPPNADPYEDGNWASCSVVCVYAYDSVRGSVD